jgi:hypothetical protein
LRVSAGRFAFAALVVVGCQGGTEPPARKITPHALADCPADQGDLVLAALGDFGSTPLATIKDFRKGRVVDWPTDFRGVEAVTYPPALHGVGYAAPPGDVEFTMWSTARSCNVIGDFPIPESRGGESITAFDDGNKVLVAGLDPRTGAAVNNSAFAMIWDARTGERLPPTSLGTRRVAWASATPFGEGALVAGGIDLKFLPARFHDTALVFRDGAFQDPPISIGDPRARHGSVVLANGATLLVGGEDERGVLDSLVAIAPIDVPPYAAADVFMLGTLSRARKLPTVMRLASDEILVAGGVDGTDAPVGTLEWFSKEGRPCPRRECVIEPIELAGLADVAFLALAGGGALAVGGTLRGTNAPSPNVLWISDDGTSIERLTPLTAQQRGTGKVMLVAASDASPWLWNGRAWLRFDPWLSAFVAPEVAPEDGPEADMPAPVAVDGGLFAWIARQGAREGPDNATLRGFRHGVRGPYARDAEFLLGDPEHLAPSRPPREGGELWADAAGLHLAPSVGVAIADATYGDVTVTGDAADGVLPALNLGAFAVGGDACPWPGAGDRFTVKRDGRAVIAEAGGASRTCSGPEGRVPIGVHGLGTSMVTVQQLTLHRR